MNCNRDNCSPTAGRCPLALFAAALFVAALLSACGPAGAPADISPAATPSASQAPPGAPARMSAEEYVAAVAPGDVTLDVRSPEEFAAGHLDGAVLANVNAPDFQERVAALDRDATTYVYCRSGNRSQRAAEEMRGMGFTRVINVGGYADLKAAGAPVNEPE